MQNWWQLFAESENNFDFLIHCRFVCSFVKQCTVSNPNHPNRQHETASVNWNEKFLVYCRFVLLKCDATSESQRSLAGALTTQTINETLLFYAEFNAFFAFSFFAEQCCDCNNDDSCCLNLTPNCAIVYCESSRQQNERREQGVTKEGSCAKSQCAVYVIYDLANFTRTGEQLRSFLAILT